jgi:hypothetical protein
LDKHPEIFVAKPFIPELKVLMRPHPDGDAGFLARYNDIFASCPPGACKIEKTSYYLENRDARERFARILPNTRIIFILRDPLRRAYSNWLWSTRNGLESLDFQTAVELEGTRESPLPPELEYARPFNYLVRSAYGTLVNAWFEAIGRERVKVVMFEEALAQPDAFISDLQQFIGVPPFPWSTLQVGATNALADYDFELPSDLVRRLRQKLSPDIRHLAELTGLNVGEWGF